MCQRGEPATHRWYAGGPLLSHIPFPIPDPSRTWGAQNCTTCKGFCSGHFFTKLVDTDSLNVVKTLMKPPSTILKQKISQLGHAQITDNFVEAAKEVLLSMEETKIWLQHLSTVVENRKRGAAKAAATCQLKRKAQQQAQQMVADAQPSMTNPKKKQLEKPISVSQHNDESNCFCGGCKKALW